MIVKIDMGYRIYVFRHIIHMHKVTLESSLREKKRGGKDIRTVALRRSTAL